MWGRHWGDEHANNINIIGKLWRSSGSGPKTRSRDQVRTEIVLSWLSYLCSLMPGQLLRRETRGRREARMCGLWGLCRGPGLPPARPGARPGEGWASPDIVCRHHSCTSSTTMFDKCNEIESQQINKNKQKVQVGISIFWNRTWPWNSF